MSTLLVVGAGGHGRVVADAALSMGSWSNVCFVDDGVHTGDIFGFPVVGRSADLNKLASSYFAAAVGIGNARTRLHMMDLCERAGFTLPCIIHRAAAVSPYASLGAGVVVFAQAAVNCGAVLGRGCIVNTGATVDHDCQLGPGVHVCPGTHLAGDVTVGARAWIGIGASVRQAITIGEDATIGVGAAVISNVEPGTTVIGVPARVRQSYS